MGYRPLVHDLELADFQGDTPEESLLVKVVAPNIREGSDINAGRRRTDDGDFAETNDAYTRRVMGYLAPKIRFWNLEDENGQPIPLPRDLVIDGVGTLEERLSIMVDHLYELDENVMLGIYHEWRLVGMAKPKESDEGKDSSASSTGGPDASASYDTVDLRQLEASIPM